ncbi:MAG: peptidoglycan DD-metalloendopeptidase family protein [Chlorobi bacterium]|nr:peptidoglycan DD-metalloendopeptidase family protein [Chlorobiota bacterium]
MSFKGCKYLVLTFSFFIVGFSVFAQQSKDELEKKRKKIEDEIAYTNKLLEETRKTKKNTLSELNLINNKLTYRNELVATLKKESYSLDNEISITENSIKNLSQDLESLKKEYSKVVYFAYKYKTSYNKLIYLFSAEDLNQAYQRMRYLNQIGDFISKQAKEIKAKEARRQEYLNSLTEKKREKNMLLDKESTQLYSLEEERSKTNALSRQILSKEKNLRAQLRRKQKEEKKLNRQISDIIAKATGTKTLKGRTSAYSLTPEERKLSESFAGNKGKLPWPTLKGVISEFYGVHDHPVLKNVKTRNNGINIATSRGSDARCVFEGKVVSVTTITNNNKAVIVKHGGFFSVYSNLEDVYVSAGDHLDIKEPLGRIHTTNQGKTEVHFEIWKGKAIQNPAYWIKR